MVSFSLVFVWAHVEQADIYTKTNPSSSSRSSVTYWSIMLKNSVKTVGALFQAICDFEGPRKFKLIA